MRFIVFVSLSLCCAAPVAAQNTATKFEITPFAAYRIGGSFSEKDGNWDIDLDDSAAEGIIFNWRANPQGQYELLYSHQSTSADTFNSQTTGPTIDLDIQQLQFGGTYLFNGEFARPFIALTIGVSDFDPKLVDLKSESFFSASFGAGIQLAANKRLGLRIEARALMTFVDDDSRVFCASGAGGGVCLIEIDGSILTQWEARAGLVFRF